MIFVRHLVAIFNPRNCLIIECCFRKCFTRVLRDSICDYQALSFCVFGVFCIFIRLLGKYDINSVGFSGDLCLVCGLILG